ncbi:hypothetical protein E2C01_073959 [Portunus trituberculatus]|uniref:Uncharacterized protein n=1 Tax=Portunus trituberculatus TaxID=210409 RepID=A0A5B7I246_PORTR|nr:hypothetical protein [Portunus trituberculatus]
MEGVQAASVRACEGVWGRDGRIERLRKPVQCEGCSAGVTEEGVRG